MGALFIYHIPSCIPALLYGLGPAYIFWGDSHGTFNQLRYHEHRGTGNDLTDNEKGEKKGETKKKGHAFTQHEPGILQLYGIGGPVLSCLASARDSYIYVLLFRVLIA